MLSKCAVGAVVVTALVATGCGGWQRKQVKDAAAERLDCLRAHAVAARKDRGKATSYWLGGCDQFWGIYVELACNKDDKPCRVRERPRSPRRSGRPLLQQAVDSRGIRASPRGRLPNPGLACGERGPGGRRALDGVVQGRLRAVEVTRPVSGCGGTIRTGTSLAGPSTHDCASESAHSSSSSRSDIGPVSS